MPTKREYAVSLGLATMGRGRLSREAHAAITKAEAGGMTFDDPVKPVITSTPSTVKSTKPVSVRREPVDVGLAGDVKTRYADDQKFVGIDSNGKKRTVNARQVCYHCRYSLTSHHCNSPRVLIGSPLEWIDVQPKGE